MNSTERYVKENQNVKALRKVILSSNRSRKIYIDSVHGILERNLLSLIRFTRRYPIEILHGFKGLKSTYKIRRSKSKIRALVIGNGPSQGYLNSEILDQFTRMGGETICVNYWNLNKDLATHVPSWMLFSDRATLNNKRYKYKTDSLVDYLRKNQNIKIVGPYWLIEQVRLKGLNNPTYSIIDSELPFLKNINPLLPRGYVSMTLYKALAWAIHLGYSEIGIVGMDNTYPRNIFCDENNHTLNLNIHSGTDDYVNDQSEMYPTIASKMADLFLLFGSLNCFPVKGIVNLDQYSLTDRFRKISLNEFFQDG